MRKPILRRAPDELEPQQSEMCTCDTNGEEWSNGAFRRISHGQQQSNAGTGDEEGFLNGVNLKQNVKIC